MSDLREAATKLVNEARGFLSMASPEVHGWTNIRCLETRIAELEAALASPPAGELSAELLAAVKPWLATYGPNFEYGYQHSMREVAGDIEYAKKCTCMRCRLQNAITAAEATLASPPAGETSFTDDELFYMWHAVIRHRPNCGVIDGMSKTFQSDLGKKLEKIRALKTAPAPTPDHGSLECGHIGCRGECAQPAPSDTLRELVEAAERSALLLFQAGHEEDSIELRAAIAKARG